MARTAKPSPVDSARQAIVSWLRAEHRNPHFLKDIPEASLQSACEEIVEAFMQQTLASGFSLDLVNDGTSETPAWVGHWTHRGYSFEGFRQPPWHPDPNCARLLACAALLQNDWCRARLP